MSAANMRDWAKTHHVRSIERRELENSVRFTAHGDDDLHVTIDVPYELLELNARLFVEAQTWERLADGLAKARAT